MPKIGRFTDAAAEAAFYEIYDDLAADWPVPFADVDVETSFGTTRVRRSGDGTGAPVLLLPGIGGNGQAWHRFIAEFSRDRVVYTPDIIGFAGRCAQTAPLTDDRDVGRWLTEVFDGLGVARVHLAGNSYGSWMAGVVAAHHSDRLASATMFEPSGATFFKPRPGLLLKFLLAGIRPTRERMRKMNKWLFPGMELDEREFDLAMAAVKFRMAMPWDRPLTDEQLASITVPMLVLYGAETVVSDPVAGAARAREHIRSVEVQTYPGIGHDLLWANPQEVIVRFRRFIDAHEPART